MMKYKDGFKCDKDSKELVKHLITEVWFSSCTVEFDEDNDTDEYADIDILFTAYTRTGKSYSKGIEIKERKGYTSTYFDDWVLEDDKYKKMLGCKNECFYLNIFRDNTYALWDIRAIKDSDTGSIFAAKRTQEESNRINKKCHLLRIDDAILTGRTI